MGYPGDLQGSSNTIRMEKCLYYGLSKVWKLDDDFPHVNISLHFCPSFAINQRFVLFVLGGAYVVMSPVQYILKRSGKRIIWQFADKNRYKEFQKDLILLNFWMMKWQMKLHVNIKWCTNKKQYCIYIFSDELWTAITMEKQESGVIIVSFMCL